jgi:hypothetical protein
LNFQCCNALAASLAKDIFERPLMDPSICSILDALLYWQSFMMGPWILLVRIMIIHGWPNDDPSPLWLHSNSKSSKVCPTAFLYIVQIQKDRQYAHTLGTLKVERYVIVMFSIELSFLILQKLPIFTIRVWDACDVLHSLDGILMRSVIVTFIQTPSVV